MTPPSLFVGIDLGTSGCRAVAVDDGGTQVAAAAVALPPPLRREAACEQNPELWWQAVGQVLQGLAAEIDLGAVQVLAVDGTSGSLVLCDEGGAPVAPALLYNDARARDEAGRIAAVAPAASGAHGASSALAKLLYLQDRPEGRRARHALHQAEWIAARLTGDYTRGDENNCLKLGYDVVARVWPAWLDDLDVPRAWLPRATAPGAVLGTLDPAVARRFGLPAACRVRAGTTDSIAGFLATGANRFGEAVTSLGSTLALKMLSPCPVFAPEYGIYSHRLGDAWLAGGASNSGGAVLRHYFSQDQLDAMTPRLDPGQATGLDYYPLLAAGERFPVHDPALAPRLAPRPAKDIVFFQGMLEGMARIEAAGYRRLAELGAPAPLSVRSVGGGAGNAAWTRIRERQLKVPVLAPDHGEAAYGTARLAMGRLLS